MPLGTAFARDIVRWPCTSLGVNIMSFLKEERGGLLKNYWYLILEKRSKETLLLVSCWTHALVGALESSPLLGGMLAMTSPWVLHCRGFVEQHCKTWKLAKQSFP